MNVFTVSFDEFKMSLLDKSISLFNLNNHINPKLFLNSIYSSKYYKN